MGKILVLPPDVDLEKPAPCPTVGPGISSCTVWNMVPQGVRNCVVFVPAKEALNQRDPAKNVFHGADIKCWKLGGSPLVQHGNTILLHSAVWSERDWFKCAEEHQRNPPVGELVLRLASGAQAAREE
jgi:hypothetical protein